MVDRSRPHGRRAARNGRTCAPPSTKPSATASPTCSPHSRRRPSPCRRRSVRSPRSGPARRPCLKWASPWVVWTSWSTPRVKPAVRGGHATVRSLASPAGCRPIENGTSGRMDARLHASPYRQRQRHHGIPHRPHGRTAARRRRTCEFMSLSAAPLAGMRSGEGHEQGESAVLDHVLQMVADIMEPAYGFHSLFRFKLKFHPDRSQSVHLLSGSGETAADLACRRAGLRAVAHPSRSHAIRTHHRAYENELKPCDRLTARHP